MRIRAGLCLIACCCAVVTACTTAPPKGPDATVTKPSVGRPPPPASEGAALDSEALTPYFDLGAAVNDGLAPGDTYAALHTACMDDAGYGQYASSTGFFVRANRGMGFPQPFGPWGYIGVSLAEQYGFNPPDTDGPDEATAPLASSASLPAGVQATANKCFNIVQAFNNTQFATSTAGIEAMNNEVSDDVINDPYLIKAQSAWTACMARNGYNSVQPNTVWRQGQTVIVPGSGSSTTHIPASPGTQTEAQIAAAVTDANCTLSTDLGGIYFAIQASYEQQFATANQQALSVAVREFKANYAKELNKLPALLRTTSATVQLLGPAGKHGKPGHAVEPSPARS